MRKIEHLGIAVKDLEAANALYTKLLGVGPYKQEAVESENVLTSFFQMGESKIELLQATDESSAIHQFIEKKGEGIHHIAFDVDDLNAELERLKADGFEVIVGPKTGADGKIIAFLHPRTSGRILVELCQDA